MAGSPRIAVFPGSFDPPTLGHVDVVSRAAKLFDKVIVALLKNSSKSAFFTMDERAGMLRDAFSAVAGVEVEVFQGLLTEFAARRHATVIVRGIRHSTDFDYEVQMAGMNRHLAPEIDTVFVAPAAQYAHISSTLVREIATLGGSLRGLVPPAVETALAARRDAQKVRQV